MTPDDPNDPKELRPTPLDERTRTALYHALVTADPLADVYHDRCMAAFVGHYFTALGPAIGRYRKLVDQDRFACEEVARFLARWPRPSGSGPRDWKSHICASSRRPRTVTMRRMDGEG